MFWQDDPPPPPARPAALQVDLLFQIDGATLPVDHAYALWQALRHALPWLEDEDQASIHSIHVATSGNGWQRPEAPDALLHLSRRTRLAIRLPRARCAEARALCGLHLDVQGHLLKLGHASERPLSPATTLFARYLISHTDETELVFLERYAAALRAKNIPTQKLLCGMTHRLRVGDTEQLTRSLLIAGLGPQESLRLQQTILGGGNKFGCGLFIPHKGIAPVKSEPDDT